MAAGISKLESLKGSVERVTFHSEETGFSVLRVKVDGKKDFITVVGNVVSVSAGEYLECSGAWVNDKAYGLQFRAEQLKVIPPATLEGIEKYLASGLIKGVGPFYAKVLVKAFGEDVFSVFDHHPEKLTKIHGIGAKRKQMILTAWADQKIIREIMIFLQTYGVGTARAVRIYKTYGDDAISIVRDNPYRLVADIYGIGFKTADALAMRLGVVKDSLKRARAGVSHVLQEFSAQGHCGIAREKLLKSAASLLEISADIIAEAVDAEVKAGNLVLDKIGSEDCLFLVSLYQAEKLSAAQLIRLKHGSPPWGQLDIKKALEWVENLTHLKLSKSQQQAVELALKEKVLIITGGPGVGKTTIVNSILKIVRAKKISVALCAPTGRAAKRLSEATRAPAKTIHRLLEFDPNTHKFTRDQYKPLAADFVIVDEVSMIDVVLMYNLLKAIPRHASLLLVGDVDQLPSVGPGTVLQDLIKSQKIPVVRLSEIFRQAAHSKIIINAHRINQGEFPIYKSSEDELNDFYFIPSDDENDIQEKLLYIVTKRIPERFGFNPLQDIQVLTPMHRGGLGTRALNEHLQKNLNAEAGPKITRFGCTFAPNDKVVQNVNNYDKEVFNGDIGRITDVNLDENEVKVNFYGRLVSYDINELDEISLAYATSIHKSQGSEYPAIVIPLATQHYMLLARNLLYTAVTRGKRLVVLIGQKKAIYMAIKNINNKPRVTKLAEHLKLLLSD